MSNLSVTTGKIIVASIGAVVFFFGLLLHKPVLILGGATAAFGAWMIPGL